MTRLRDALASQTAVAALVGFIASMIALPFVEEGGSVVVALAGCAVLYATWRSVAREDRALLWVVIVAYATRIAAIAGLFVVAYVTGRAPFIFGDEAGYVETASFVSRPLRAGGDPIQLLLGSDAPGGADPFQDVQALLFVFLGEQAGLIKVVNALLGVMCALLAFDTVRSIFGVRAARAAAWLVAFFPTLFLWSVTGIRDIWIVTLILLSLWAFERLRRRARWMWLAVGLLGIAWIQGLRQGLYLALLLPHIAATVAATRGLQVVRRLAYCATAAVIVYAVLMQMSGFGFLGVDFYREGTLRSLEQQAAYFALGARTAFRPAYANPQGQVVLPVGEVVRIEPAPTQFLATEQPLPSGTPRPSPTPASTRRPSATPRPAGGTGGGEEPSPTPIVVQPGQQVVLLEPDVPEPPNKGNIVVYVRPGDLVVLEGPRRSVDPRPYVVSFGEQNYVISQDEVSGTPARLRRIAASIPVGVVFVVAAPIFGLTSTGLELPLLPEMLLWLASLVAAILTVARERRHGWDIFPIATYAVVILLLLSVVEGNVGTLIRHRSMLVAPVLLLAAPTFSLWLDRLRPAARRLRRSTAP